MSRKMIGPKCSHIIPPAAASAAKLKSPSRKIFFETRAGASASSRLCNSGCCSSWWSCADIAKLYNPWLRLSRARITFFRFWRGAGKSGVEFKNRDGLKKRGRPFDRPLRRLEFLLAPRFSAATSWMRANCGFCRPRRSVVRAPENASKVSGPAPDSWTPSSVRTARRAPPPFFHTTNAR